MTKLLKIILLATLLGPRLAAAMCPTSGDLDISQIATQVTSISFDTDSRGKSITAFGTLKNMSPLCAQDIVVEVKYFDSKGAQVDVTTQTLGVTIGAGQETAFRVRDDASKEREAYATGAIRVIAAEPLFGRAGRSESSWWIDLLSAWGPMLLLILIFGLFIRRLSGKNSPQRQSLALVQRQQESLERIAAALEKRVQP
jgi:ATP-dependent Zn protease